MLLAILLAIGGCCSTSTIVTTKDGLKVPIPSKCDPLVQYQATHFSFDGIDVSIPQADVVVKLGKVEWKKDQLQQAAVAAQLLDMQRISSCEYLPTRASVCSASELHQYLDKYENFRYKLVQLGMIMNSNDPEAPKKTEKFIKTYFEVKSVYEKSGEGKEVRFLAVKENVAIVPMEKLFK
jgi:hypothetical protein